MSLKYDAAREAFGNGSLSWTRDKIVAQLVSRVYVAESRHSDARQLKGLVGKPVVLDAKSIPGGWAKAGELAFRQIEGDEVVAVVLRRETFEPNRSILIAYLNDVDKFPMRPNGGDILIDPPAPGFFRI